MSLLSPPITSPSGFRINTIDTVRGIAMVIMALDHVRDFFYSGALSSDATDLRTTTAALFFTRWITHFCAPTFVLLSGTSVYLQALRKDKKELSLFLLKRGCWLIFVEVVIIRLAFFFNFYYDMTFLTVFWVMGAGMIMLAALIHLKDYFVLVIGVLLITLHNFSYIIQPADGSILFGPWMLFFRKGMLTINATHAVIVAYPILPWLGIMLVGYFTGRLFKNDFIAERRIRLLTRWGIAYAGIFILLRIINVNDDIMNTSPQKNLLFDFLNFINVTKAPPSMLFSFLMMGFSFLALAGVERSKLKISEFFNVFGRVPFFYFVLHFYVIHAVSLLLQIILTGQPIADIDFHFGKSFGGITGAGGVSLFWVYAVWIALVLALYPLCKWYGEYRRNNNNWWLRYL